MSQTIEVDDEVYARLQAEAQALVNTLLNSALRRKFGLPSAPASTAVKPPTADLTEKTQKVLIYIQAAGGAGTPPARAAGPGALVQWLRALHAGQAYFAGASPPPNGQAGAVRSDRRLIPRRQLALRTLKAEGGT